MIITVIMVQYCRCWRAGNSIYHDAICRRRGVAIFELNLHRAIYFYRIGGVADYLLMGNCANLGTDGHLCLLETHLLVNRLVVWPANEPRDGNRRAMLYNGVKGCARALNTGRTSLHWKSMANRNRLALLYLIVHHRLRAGLASSGSGIPDLIRGLLSEPHAFFTLKLAHYVFTS